MQSIHKILKISARYAFKGLKNNSPFFCTALHANVVITRVFWEHINFTKNRSVKELILRLSVIPLIEEILKTGNVAETRKDNNMFYKVSIVRDSYIFSLIILQDEKRNSCLFLMSCFVDEVQKK